METFITNDDPLAGLMENMAGVEMVAAGVRRDLAEEIAWLLHGGIEQGGDLVEVVD